MKNRSAPPGPIVPALVYRDVERAVEWLAVAFGFSERLRWGPPGEPTVQLDVGEGAIFVHGPRRGHGTAESLAFEPPNSNELNITLMVDVTDVDSHREQASAAGAAILLEVQTYAFGERQYSTRDLEGYVWTFTQSVQDVDPQAWGAVRQL
jgi:uncharacterized glyoxalase superfamily protein PhnB